jgi:hypothetical protein
MLILKKKIYDTEKAKKWIMLVACGTYIYDEQEHIQGTHGTTYNWKFSSAFSPRFAID